MKEEKEEFPSLLPKAMKVAAQTIGNQLKSYTAEETATAMKEMFRNFEKKTGYKVMIQGDSLPTRVLIPEENKSDDKDHIVL